MGLPIMPTSCMGRQAADRERERERQRERETETETETDRERDRERAVFSHIMYLRHVSSTSLQHRVFADVGRERLNALM